MSHRFPVAVTGHPFSGSSRTDITALGHMAYAAGERMDGGGHLKYRIGWAEIKKGEAEKGEIHD